MSFSQILVARQRQAWVVQDAAKVLASSVHGTQGEALNAACAEASRKGGGVVILQDEDGQFRDEIAVINGSNGNGLIVP